MVVGCLAVSTQLVSELRGRWIFINATMSTNELHSHTAPVMVCLNILCGRQVQEVEVGMAMNGTHAMLCDSNLPPHFWAEVRLIFMDLCNRMLMRVDSIMPDEHSYGMKLDVDTYTPIVHVMLPSKKLLLPLAASMAISCLTVAFLYSLNLQAAMEIRCSSVQPGAWWAAHWEMHWGDMSAWCICTHQHWGYCILLTF